MASTRTSQDEVFAVPRLSSETAESNSSAEDAAISDILSKIEIETKIRDGAENLLQVFDTRKHKDGTVALRAQVESQLDSATARIQLLQGQLNQLGARNDYQHAYNSNALLRRSSDDFTSSPHYDICSVDTPKDGDGRESPTYLLDDLLQALQNSKQQSDFLVTKSNELVNLLQRHSILKYDISIPHLMEKIKILLLHVQTEVVACGYRVARHAITDVKSIKMLRSFYMDIMVIRSLSKDNKAQIERIHALRLIRFYADIKDGVNEISKGVVRAIAAVAEQSDDKLQNIAIETLAEICIKAPQKVADGGGLRILLQCMVDGPYEMSLPVGIALSYIYDLPDHRHLLRDGRDLELLVSAFTDFHLKGQVYVDRLRNSAKVLSSLLRGWSGLLAVSVDEFRSLKSLVKCLEVPIPTLRDILMDLFYSIFLVKSLPWSSSFLAGRRLTTFGRAGLELKDLQKHSKKKRSRFADHYLSLLLMVLEECGLTDSLTVLLQTNNDPSIARKATLLLGEILNMSGKVALPDLLAKIAVLPNLFTSAMTHKTSGDAAASSAIFQIEKISRNLNKSRGGWEYDIPPTKSSELSKEVRVRINSQIDDASFKQLIIDTQILHTKTFTKWNWSILMELIQGPLLNPKRLEEAIKTTKFMKRLLSFYRPFKYRFSSIKKTKPNQKYVEVGKALFKTFLANPEGVKYLMENKLLRQIAECLAQIDPMSGITAPEPLFSTQRLQSTLSSGYFSLLGTLSADPNGLEMMEKWRMFSMFYHLTELRSRDDLLISVIESMDYELVGHPRIIMSKAITSSSIDVRVFGTSFLRKFTESSSPDTQKWAVGLLVIQLYDPAFEVRKLAVEVLEEYCQDRRCLEHLIRLRPTIDHLGDIGTPLLLLFLSSSTGFRHLKESGYADLEMENWYGGQNEAYSTQMEEYLESELGTWADGDITSSNAALQAQIDESSCMLPLHFYGTLTLTEEGCELLRAHGHIASFASFIRENKAEESDRGVINKLKGLIWAVGNIASTPLGVPFLEDNYIVQDLIWICQESRICSLKGTAFFALGLISSTYEGAEILDEYNWVSVRQVLGAPTGIVLPKSLSQLFGPNWTSPCSSKKAESPNAAPLFEDEEDPELQQFPRMGVDDIRGKILGAIANMGNQILANEASRELVKLRSQYRSKFSSTEIFMEAMNLIEKYHYKLPVRRFIFELFNTSQLLERIAARKKKSQRKGRHSGDSKVDLSAL